MGLVGLAHCVSHFSQLLLPPLFPWLKDAFHASYAELGFLLTVFFVVSCSVQALSGFVVDRFGPRPILFGGIACSPSAAFGFAQHAATRCWRLRGRRRHRQRRLPSGRLHLAQSQDPSLAPRPRVQRPRHHRQPRLGARAGDAGADRARLSWRVALASAGVLALVVLARAGAQPVAPDDRHDQRRQAARGSRGRREAASLSSRSPRSGCASASSSSTPSSSAASRRSPPRRRAFCTPCRRAGRRCASPSTWSRARAGWSSAASSPPIRRAARRSSLSPSASPPCSR